MADLMGTHWVKMMDANLAVMMDNELEILKVVV